MAIPPNAPPRCAIVATPPAGDAVAETEGEPGIELAVDEVVGRNLFRRRFRAQATVERVPPYGERNDCHSPITG